MTSLTPARIRLALAALALGGFGIGAAEFAAMGVLPEIASDLLPALAASDPEQAIARAGILISAYAAGVVVGAPTIAVVAARFPRKTLLLALVIAFTVGTLASALAPTFELVVVARFLAALPHGAYFGIAALVAASLMGPGKRGQGIALVLSGLTIANVIGVPAITFLGQNAGWRAAYLAVAAIFALTAVAILLVVPKQPGDPDATVRRELGGFSRPAVWFALLTGALGFGGLFAVYTYVAPLTTEVTRLPEGVVPIALVAMGVGMTLGNLAGGRLADRGALRAIFACFALLVAALLGLALAASTVPGLFAGLFAVGFAAAAISPAIQTRLMDVAGDSQTLAAAANHSALNIGNSLGALLGGAVIAAGWGYVAPTWVGLALCLPGILLAVLGGLVSRSEARRSEGARRVVLDEDAVLDRALP
jgi:DHA1 family inner membrane transport protein